MKYLFLAGILFTSSCLQAASCQSKDENKQSLKHSKMQRPREDHSLRHKNLQQSECYEQGGSFFLDYLIMRAQNSDLIYASSNLAAEVPGAWNNRVVEGKMFPANRTWRPGFRVGFDWRTPQVDWDVCTSWTYYYNKSVTDAAHPDIWLDSANENKGQGFYGYWGIGVRDDDFTVPGSRYQNFKGVWQLNYNMINLEFGNDFRWFSNFSMRPHFGLQNGWIHQKISVLYSRSFYEEVPTTSTARDTLVHANNKYWGIGFRGGVDTSWELSSGFSFLAKVSASLLSGRTTNRTVQSADFQKGKDFLRFSNATDRLNHFAPGLQGLIGLQWSTDPKEGDMGFSIGAFWESNFWWAQFNFLQTVVPKESGLGDQTRNYSERYPLATSGLLIEGVTVRGVFQF